MTTGIRMSWRRDSTPHPGSCFMATASMAVRNSSCSTQTRLMASSGRSPTSGSSTSVQSGRTWRRLDGRTMSCCRVVGSASGEMKRAGGTLPLVPAATPRAVLAGHAACYLRTRHSRMTRNSIWPCRKTACTGAQHVGSRGPSRSASTATTTCTLIAPSSAM